jgi:predicted helicase
MQNTQYGYIYVRSHESYDKYNVYKLGIASNIPERDSQYATSEIKRGKFILVIEVFINQMDVIEKMLHNRFDNLHVQFDGGTEFYKREIISLIVPYLENIGFEFRKLTKEEIDNLTRTERTKTNIPNEQQLQVLDMIMKFYNKNDIGKLIWACGLGKTLLSIWCIKLLNFKSVLIGVPSKYLQNQMRNEILKIFPNKKYILCVGSDNSINSTTDRKIIDIFLKNKLLEYKFIITTYMSCSLLLEYSFDFKIGDEAHHLVGMEDEKISNKYKAFHKINSNKTMFMTATEKIVDPKDNTIIFSMNDEKIFGKYIDTKSVKWAVENKKITDYCILLIKNTDEEIDDIIRTINIKVTDRELFISVFMTLKAIDFYKKLITHTLIFTNSIENTEITKKYIDMLLDKNIFEISKKDIYNNNLHSNKKNNFFEEVNKFKNSKYGIISCVYIFGEGFDLPKLNCVVFAENMTSEIRIVQTSLRPIRLENDNPSKLAYIIIPYIDNNGWSDEDKSFNKVRTIISSLRNVDENVEQKIHIITRKNKKNKDDNKEKKTYKIDIDNDDEMNKIKLRLRCSKTLNSKCSEEQDEYNYVKLINKSLNIKSKEEYVRYELKHEVYIDNPEVYFKSKCVWTNWYDFIGVDTSKYFKTKQELIKFCKDKNIRNIPDYEKACKIYEQLPYNPCEMYIDFSNINIELGYNGRFK